MYVLLHSQLGSTSPVKMSSPEAKFSSHINFLSCKMDNIIAFISKTGTVTNALLVRRTDPYVGFKLEVLYFFSILSMNC